MPLQEIDGRVFGEPYRVDGITLIPVSRVRGGVVHAVGVYVVDGTQVTWRPAVDETRLALTGMLIGLVATTLSLLAIIRRPPWPDLSGRLRIRR